MKVILTKDIPGSGRAGDIKEVSDGYARNFLIPKHLALPASSEILSRVQKEESEKQTKIAKEQERFVQLKKKLENKIIKLKAKANKTNLFAAVHEVQIAKAINDTTGAEIGPDIIFIKKPIKSLGEHEVEIRFAKDHIASVKLVIESE